MTVVVKSLFLSIRVRVRIVRKCVNAGFGVVMWQFDEEMGKRFEIK